MHVPPAQVAPAAVPAAPARDTAGADTVRVLFIGNSYTYVNNLPALLERMAATAHPRRTLITARATMGGRTLRWHLTRGRALAAIGQGRWDYVVLQEQSLLGPTLVDGRPTVSDAGRVFAPAARTLASAARAAGATPLFYLTWARQARPETQPRLTAAYAAAARAAGAPLAPVGLAWERARRELPDVALYDGDGSHPTPAGSYLAAAVFYATLFGAPPAGAADTVRGHPAADDATDTSRTVTLAALAPATAAALRDVAWRTVAALRAGGGYPSAAPVARLAVPALPTAGRPTAAAALVGRWRGTLRLYPAEWGQSPATVELALQRVSSGAPGGTQSGTSDGTLTVRFPRDTAVYTLPVTGARVAGGVLHFAAPFRPGEPAAVQYRAVLTAAGLRGVAERREDRDDELDLGSWDAARVGPDAGGGA